MPVRRVDIPSELDDAARRLSEDRGTTPETQIRVLIEEGLRRERRNALTRLLLWIAAPLTTAVLVTVLLRALPTPRLYVPELTLSGEILVARSLHWARVFAASLFPWPFTIMVVSYFLFGTRWGFSNLLQLFALFRKFSFGGASIELNEATKSKIQSAASDIGLVLKEYRQKVDTEVARLIEQYQIDHKLGRFVDEEIIKRFGRDRLGDDFRCIST